MTSADLRARAAVEATLAALRDRDVQRAFALAEGRIHVCVDCDGTFPSAAALAVHERGWHAGEGD